VTAPSITQFYEDDHDRLDGLFAKFQDFKKSDLAKARLHFDEFKNGLERHIRWEEDVLFPVFETKTGHRDTGPTAVMRMEHRDILAILELIQQKLQSDSLQTDAEEARLFGHLGIHNMKEEQILYPSIDRIVSEGERLELFTKMGIAEPK